MGTRASAVATQSLDSQCCSAVYEQDWVRAIAQDCFHPGGEDLTRRSVQRMGLKPGARLVDLGCGTGSSAFLLADEFGLRVTGIDASTSNIGRAVLRSGEKKSIEVGFQTGEAANLPLPDASADAMLAECAFSLFPNKPAALAECRRVLKPGGRFSISDMAVEGSLPEEMDEVLAPWTCLVDAMNRGTFQALFEQAGFRVAEFSDESEGLTSLIGSLKRKLLLLAAGNASGMLPSALPLSTVRYWLDRVRAEVDAGVIRYYGFSLISDA
jgi:ubiquinone/menaquinone biosynthesis C-methylase UbiE